MIKPTSRQRGFALALLPILLIMALAWFGTLDYRKLVKPDEGRYAEIPREMVATGDWLTPRLNDLKYFEKPALQYWATAAAFEAFGAHEWTARLWPALTGFLGILLAGYTGSRLFGRREGTMAAAVLGSSVLYAAMAHIITLDMGLSFFMQAALSGFLLANRPEASPEEGRRWMLFTWAMVALATLTKGIVAPVLAGGTLVFYSLLARDLSPWRRLHLIPGLALFLALAAPWFVAVTLKNPEFFHFFFIHEHFERFLTKSHHRFQPWWFFLPILALGMLPWASMLPQILWSGWKSPLPSPPSPAGEGGERREPRHGFNPRRFLLVWSVLIFVFFSISDSKLPSYVLPIFPALALLAGDWLAKAGRLSLVRHFSLVAILAGAALLASPLVKMAANPEQPLAMMADYARWLAASSAIWFAGSAAALALAWRGRLGPAVYLAAVATFVVGQGALLGHESLAASNSAASLAQQLRPQLTPGVPFYSVRTYEQTLPFYIQRTVTLVEFGDELSFGIQQEPQKFVPTVKEFEARWRADKDAFALMTPDTYAELEKDGLPMTIAARDLRRIVVRKPQ
ncbi:MAG: glycosyltransferase family 39 protein [Rhodocyclaceae bacterium]|nr:glycosyltransferase family 39 protein [Rhodocyclaceae bacterium]